MSNLFTALTRAKRDQQEILEKQAELSDLTPSKDGSEDEEIKEFVPSPEKKEDVVFNSGSKENPRLHDTMTPRNRDTTTPRHHDTTIEAVRKAVKIFGKEAATHRFTVEEKKAVAEVIYLFRQQGVRTSENEIARIAINFLIEDYKKNDSESVLDKVLKALND